MPPPQTKEHGEQVRFFVNVAAASATSRLESAPKNRSKGGKKGAGKKNLSKPPAHSAPASVGLVGGNKNTHSACDPLTKADAVRLQPHLEGRFVDITQKVIQASVKNNALTVALRVPFDHVIAKLDAILHTERYPSGEGDAIKTADQHGIVEPGLANIYAFLPDHMKKVASKSFDVAIQFGSGAGEDLISADEARDALLRERKNDKPSPLGPGEQKSGRSGKQHPLTEEDVEEYFRLNIRDAFQASVDPLSTPQAALTCPLLKYAVKRPTAETLSKPLGHPSSQGGSGNGVVGSSAVRASTPGLTVCLEFSNVVPSSKLEDAVIHKRRKPSLQPEVKEALASCFQWVHVLADAPVPESESMPLLGGISSSASKTDKKRALVTAMAKGAAMSLSASKQRLPSSSSSATTELPSYTSPMYFEEVHAWCNRARVTKARYYVAFQALMTLAVAVEKGVGGTPLTPTSPLEDVLYALDRAHLIASSLHASLVQLADEQSQLSSPDQRARLREAKVVEGIIQSASTVVRSVLSCPTATGSFASSSTDPTVASTSGDQGDHSDTHARGVSALKRLKEVLSKCGKWMLDELARVREAASAVVQQYLKVCPRRDILRKCVCEAALDALGATQQQVQQHIATLSQRTPSEALASESAAQLLLAEEDARKSRKARQLEKRKRGASDAKRSAATPSEVTSTNSSNNHGDIYVRSTSTASRASQVAPPPVAQTLELPDDDAEAVRSRHRSSGRAGTGNDSKRSEGNKGKRKGKKTFEGPPTQENKAPLDVDVNVGDNVVEDYDEGGWQEVAKRGPLDSKKRKNTSTSARAARAISGTDSAKPRTKKGKGRSEKKSTAPSAVSALAQTSFEEKVGSKNRIRNRTRHRSTGKSELSGNNASSSALLTQASHDPTPLPPSTPDFSRLESSEFPAISQPAIPQQKQQQQQQQQHADNQKLRNAATQRKARKDSSRQDRVVADKNVATTTERDAPETRATESPLSAEQPSPSPSIHPKGAMSKKLERRPVALAGSRSSLHQRAHQQPEDEALTFVFGRLESEGDHGDSPSNHAMSKHASSLPLLPPNCAPTSQSESAVVDRKQSDGDVFESESTAPVTSSAASGRNARLRSLKVDAVEFYPSSHVKVDGVDDSSVPAQPPVEPTEGQDQRQPQPTTSSPNPLPATSSTAQNHTSQSANAMHQPLPPQMHMGMPMMGPTRMDAFMYPGTAMMAHNPLMPPFPMHSSMQPMGNGYGHQMPVPTPVGYAHQPPLPAPQSLMMHAAPPNAHMAPMSSPYLLHHPSAFNHPQPPPPPYTPYPQAPGTHQQPPLQQPPPHAHVPSHPVPDAQPVPLPPSTLGHAQPMHQRAQARSNKHNSKPHEQNTTRRPRNQPKSQRAQHRQGGTNDKLQPA